MSQFVFHTTTIDYQCIDHGFPLLFLHGWGMDKRIMSGCFEPIFQQKHNYQRIYLDLPGMGQSIAGDVTSSDDILEVLTAFAHEVIGQKFILVGESYGGYIARGFAKLHPEMIAGMILLCPLVIPGTRQGQVESLKVMQCDNSFLQTLSPTQYDSFTYMNVVLTQPVWERYKRDILPAINTQNRHFLDNVLDGRFSFDPEELDRPHMFPCLILVGKQDSEVGYKDQFNLLHTYPNATYCVINRAGHNLQIEQPEMFQSIVTTWLDHFIP